MCQCTSAIDDFTHTCNVIIHFVKGLNIVVVIVQSCLEYRGICYSTWFYSFLVINNHKLKISYSKTTYCMKYIILSHVIVHS